MENENLIIKDDGSNEEIKNLIYTIRGKQVMLDSDVARLFDYATKDLNRNVKNNILKCFAHAVAQATDVTEAVASVISLAIWA